MYWAKRSLWEPIPLGWFRDFDPELLEEVGHYLEVAER